jgi:PAS domain-containing protein
MDPQTHRAFELLRRLSSEGIDLVDLDAESAVGDASVRQWLGVPHTAPLGPQGRFLCLGAVEGGSLFLWQHGATPPPVVLLGDEGEVAVASPSLEAFVRRNANERFVGRLAAWLAPEDDDEDQVAAAVAQAVRGWGPAPADPEHPDFLAWVHAHRAPRTPACACECSTRVRPARSRSSIGTATGS